MSGRDWFEIAWHAVLLLVVVPPVLRFLLMQSWARALVAVIIIGALGYHVAVVQACHAKTALCYWGGW